VFLTGGTGFVGVHLLDALLRRTKAIVYCLVRTKATAQSSTDEPLSAAAARLWTVFTDTYQLQCVASVWNERVVLLTGSLGARVGVGVCWCVCALMCIAILLHKFCSFSLFLSLSLSFSLLFSLFLRGLQPRPVALSGCLCGTAERCLFTAPVVVGVSLLRSSR
jgi:Male sterility protein